MADPFTRSGKREKLFDTSSESRSDLNRTGTTKSRNLGDIYSSTFGDTQSRSYSDQNKFGSTTSSFRRDPRFDTPEASGLLGSILGPSEASGFYSNTLNTAPGTITPEIQRVLDTLSGISNQQLGEDLAGTRGQFFRSADTAGQLGFEDTFVKNRLQRDAAVAQILEQIRQQDIERQFAAAGGLQEGRGQDIGLLDLLRGEETAGQTDTRETIHEDRYSREYTEQIARKIVDMFAESTTEESEQEVRDQSTTGRTEEITEEEVSDFNKVMQLLDLFGGGSGIGNFGTGAPPEGHDSPERFGIPWWAVQPLWGYNG